MANNLGTLYVSIVPTTKGITGNVYRELSPEVTGAAEKAGRDAGRAMGDGIGKTLTRSIGDVRKATRTLGTDLRKSLDPAVSAARRFKDGFNDANAAASSFTGKVGTLGGAVRKASDQGTTFAKNFVGGFNDADAAASALTGRIGSIGGVVRKASQPVITLGRQAAISGQNFVAGFNDAQAASSALTGYMGTLGGAVSRVAKPAARLGTDFVAGFRDAQAASSSFTGHMGSLGGVARRATDAAVRATESVKAAGSRAAGVLRSAAAGASTVASGVTASFSTFGSSMSQAFAPVMGRIRESSDALIGLGSTAVDVGAGVVAAVAGIAVTGGIKRALDIEDAQAKLRGLGHDTTTVDGIMKNALASVKGTAFGLGEAATTAAQAVASGIQPGEELEQSLKTVANSAAAAGVGMDEMGAVFGKAMASGKAQNDVLYQLSDRGIPIYQALADQMGVTTDEIFKMASKGQISYAEFEEAARQAVGTVADEMGKTTRGGIKNFFAALSRLGEAGIKPLLPLFNQLVAGGTALADSLTAYAAPAGEWLARSLGSVADVAGRAVEGVKGIVGAIPPGVIAAAATVVGVLAAKFGVAAVAGSKIGGVLATVFGVVSKIVPGLGLLGKVVGALTGPWGLVIGLIVAAVTQSEPLRAAIGGLVQQVMDLAGGVGSSLGPVLSQLASQVLPVLAQLFSTVVDVVAQVLIVVVQIASALLSVLVPVISTLAQILLPILAVAFQAIAWVLNTVVLPVILWLVNMLGTILPPVISAIPGIFSGAFNLVAGVMTWLRDTIFIPVWNAIKWAISGVMTWFTGSAVPGFQVALNWLGTAMSWLYVNIVQPVWTGIKTVIAVAVAIIMTIFEGWVWVFKNVLGPAFNWFYNTVVIPVWNGIKWFINAAWVFIRDYIFTPIRNFITGPLASVFNWFYRNLIVPVWNGIRSAISAAGNFLQWVWQGLINFVRGPLASIFRWFKDNLITPVWNGIKWIIDRLVAGIRWILQRLIDFVRGPLGNVFNWIRDKADWAWNGIKNIVSNVWNTVRDRVLNPMIRFLENQVISAWYKTKDGIDKAWTAIKKIVDGPVDFVINTVINSGFIKNFNKVAEKFGIDTISEISYKGLARGGVVPGYQRRKVDDHLYPVAGGGVQPLRGGEGILVPEATRALDPSWIHGINAAANHGGVSGAKSWLDDSKPSIETFPKANDKRFAVGPPGGPSGGLWSSNQARASQLGYFMVPRGSLGGVSFESAAQAWMGRSALDIRMGSGGPGVQSISGGGGGPWGFATSDGRITITPGGPASVGKNAVRGTLIHEIGHVLSLGHPPGGYGATGSIMSAGMNGGYWPSSADYRALASVFGAPGEGVKVYDDPGGGGGILSGLLAAIGFDGLLGKIPGAGFATDLMVGAAKQVWEGFKSWVASVINPFDGGDSEVASSQSSENWRDTVIEALKRAGLPSTKPYQDAWVKQIGSESGGDPNAIQGAIGDVNNMTGDLGKGLVQVIGSTFAAHRDPSLPNNQLDPLANLVAGMRYAKARYGAEGMLSTIGKGHGYALGGILPDNLSTQVFDGGGWLQKTTDPMLVQHRETKPDAVLTNAQFNDMHALAESVRQNPQKDILEPHFHFEGMPDDADHIGRRASEALAFELMREGL